MKTKVGRFFRNNWLGIVSALLTFVLAVVFLPNTLIVTADSIREAIAESEDDEIILNYEPDYSIQATETSSDEPYILFEDQSLRTEYTKHYYLSNNTYLAQTSLYPIHYLDETGKYEDIDNTLIEERTDDETIRNNANSFRVEFSKNISREAPLVSIAEKDYGFEMFFVPQSSDDFKDEMADFRASQAVIVSPNGDEVTSYNGKKPSEMVERTTLSGKLNYSDVQSGTDLSFAIEGKAVKESITIKSKSEKYIYKFAIKTDDLFLELDDTGCICAYDVNGATVFDLVKPYMHDSVGEYSSGVNYELEKLDGGYILTINADADWINSQTRVFPVTIEPEIKSTVVNENFAIRSLQSHSEINGSVTNEYMLDYNSNLKGKAVLERKLIVATPNGSAVNVSVIPDNDEQSETENVISTQLIGDRTEITLPNDVEKFNFTVNAANATLAEAVSETPTLNEIYINEMGVDESFYLQSYDNGDNKVYVKLRSYTYTIELPIYSMEAPAMPLSVIAYYNPYYSEEIKTLYKDYVGYYGKDIKLNIEQYMIQESKNYYYIDADGSKHIFIKETNGNYDYICKELGYYYKSSENSVYDKNDNKIMHFTDNKLTDIYNEDGQSIHIVFSQGNKITSIYNRINYLESFQTMTFNYSGSLLSNINNVAFLTYNEDSYLTEIGEYAEKNSSNAICTKSSINYSSQTVKVENRYSSPCYIEFLKGVVFNVSCPANKINNSFIPEMNGACIGDYKYNGVTYSDFVMHFDSNGVLKESLLKDSFNNIMSVSTTTEGSDANIKEDIAARFETYLTLGDYENNIYSYYPHDRDLQQVRHPAIILYLRNHGGGSPCKFEVSYMSQSGSTPEVFDLQLDGTVQYYVLPISSMPSAITIQHLCEGGGSFGYIDVALGDVISKTNTTYYNKDFGSFKKGDRLVTQASNEETITTYYSNDQIMKETYKNANGESRSKTYTYNSTRKHLVSSIKTVTISRSKQTENTYYTYDPNKSLTTQVRTVKGNREYINDYKYDSINGNLTEVKTSDGHIINYEYNSDCTIHKEIKDAIETEFTYDLYGRLASKISGSGTLYFIRDGLKFIGYDYGSQSYRYVYDNYGKIIGLTRNGENLFSKEINPYDEEITFGNDQTVKNSYSGDHLVSVEYSTGEIYNFNRNSYELMNVTFDNITKKYDTNYNRTSSGIETEFTETTSGDMDYSRSVEFNAEGYNIGTTYTINGVSHKATTNYDSYIEERINNVTDGEFKTVYSYNNDQVSAELKTLNGKSYSDKRYSYMTVDFDNKTRYTNLCIQMIDGDTQYDMAYDMMGNIVFVKRNGSNYLEYNYDEKSRLIYEKNYATDQSYSYTYDSNNNLATVTDKTPKPNSGPINPLKDVYNYSYSGDRLERVYKTALLFGDTYSTDGAGNHIKYRDMTFSWTQGKKLKTVSKKENNAYFTPVDVKYVYSYDENGIRYKKEKYNSANNLVSTTRYYLDGNMIIAEDRDGILLNYYYDANGVVGMKYNDVYYYFVKDIFGNVVQVKDLDGQVYAQYEYTAWGNCSIIKNEKNIATINPFRYRSYYTDNETDFYYLQTRFYDPVAKRFISADNYDLLPTLSETGEINLYVYCCNNPVMFTDENGESIFVILALIFLAGCTILGATYNGIKSYDNGNRGWGLGKDIVLGALGGLAGGGVLIMLGSVFISPASGFAATALRVFAIGALAYDIVTAFFLPLFGENDWPLIELGGDSSTPQENSSTPPITEVNIIFGNNRYSRPLNLFKGQQYDKI